MPTPGSHIRSLNLQVQGHTQTQGKGTSAPSLKGVLTELKEYVRQKMLLYSPLETAVHHMAIDLPSDKNLFFSGFHISSRNGDAVALVILNPSLCSSLAVF